MKPSKTIRFSDEMTHWLEGEAERRNNEGSPWRWTYSSVLRDIVQKHILSEVKREQRREKAED